MSGLVTVFSCLIVIYEVVMRYIFKKPTSWVNLTSEVLLVYITFLAASWILRERGHVKVDIIENFLITERGKVRIKILQDIFSLFFCLVFTWITWGYFWNTFSTQERYGGGLFTFPLWMGIIVIPFGGALLCIQLFRELIEDVGYILRKSE